MYKLKNMYVKHRNHIHKYRISCLLLVLLLLPTLQFTIAAQTKTITLNLTNVTVMNAIKEIERVSGYKFQYNPSELNTTRNVSVYATNEPLKTVVEKILPGYKVSIQGKSIIITVEKKALAVDKSTGDLERFVIGKVTDEDNDEPMIGVVVRSKLTGKGVTTDINGNYSLKAGGRKDIFTFSLVGYQPKEAPVEDLAVLNIKMTSTNTQLSEAVVTGGGVTQKRISVIGAITSIKGAQLTMPTSSLTTALAGQLAGLIAQTSTGEPGKGSEFYIRGISTFGGVKRPLIMLDDIEISPGDLNSIPPETIESFSLLKDASATAIYGSRGANGVLLVKTKTGKENERTRINVTMEGSVNQPLNFPKFVDGATWMELYNEAQLSRNPLDIPRFTQQQIDNTRNHVNIYAFPDVNWNKVIFRDYSTSQRANLNVTGGGSKVTYYMSLQVNHDTGILNSEKAYSWNNNIDNLGFNFQNNIGYKLTPSTTIDLRMNTQFRQNRGGNYNPGDIFDRIRTENPVNYPITLPAQPNDTYIRFGSTLQGLKFQDNLWAKMVNSFKQWQENAINTQLKISQDFNFITKGLNAYVILNFKNWSANNYSQSIDPYLYRVVPNTYDPATNTYTTERLGTGGAEYITQSDITRDGDNTIFVQANLYYNRRFGLHSLGAMLLYTQREFRDNILPQRNQGYSGRITYDYDNRYLAEFNCGYTGTERLAKNNRFEAFPAVSVGWVPSGEDFFMPLKSIVSFLKIRSSYGLIGSDQMDDTLHFLYLNKVKLDGGGSYTTGEDMGVRYTGPTITQYSVDGARWEKALNFNLGADLELFNSVNFTFDYFFNRRYDILLKRDGFPNSLGYIDKPWANRGKVNNEGFEASVNYSKQVTKDFNVNLRFNFTFNKNKFIDKDEPANLYPWKRQIGRPLGTTEGYIAEGLFTSQKEIDESPVQNLGTTVLKPGDIKYRDITGDGQITSDDITVISPYNGYPRLQYGFGLNLSYKKFDMGMFFNGSGKRTIMTGTMTPFYSTDNNVFQYIADNRWTESNPDPNAKYPRLGVTQGDTGNNNNNSTYWMRDGSFLRFKLFELGYRFRGGRIYFSSNNIAVFSKFKQWDPELNWNSYPLQRVYNMGIQFNF